MWSWWSVCQWLVVISLLFFAIPIKVPDPEQDIRDLFDDYIIKFQKPYLPGSDEYEYRYVAFKDTLKRIESYNNATSRNETAKYGFTKFSDLTEKEFKDKHLNNIQRVTDKSKNRNRTRPNRLPSKIESYSYKNDEELRKDVLAAGLPLKIDWRRFGVIGEVRDQGMCGACWAFSTVETIEAMNAKLKHNLTVLSVQQMIDCAANGNQGCAGGDICTLLEWLYKFKIPVQTDRSYPYNRKTNQCAMRDVKNESGGGGVRVADYTCQSFVDSEMEILKWVANGGPVAAAVNALSWQNYLGGVIRYHCDGGPGLLNHAVQIVGYDLTANVPHYIAKNSWGKRFGNDGYVHLAVGTNMCGIAMEVSMIDVL